MIQYRVQQYMISTYVYDMTLALCTINMINVEMNIDILMCLHNKHMHLKGYTLQLNGKIWTYKLLFSK